jgi:hypothetical protein
MKKLSIFLLVAFVCGTSYGASYQIKKAAPVSQQKQGGVEALTANSLLPTALNLVTNIIALNQQTKAMDAKCAPTSGDIEFVKKLMKEWAKAGGVVKDVNACEGAESGNTYAAEAQRFHTSGGSKPCTNVFTGPGNTGQIWDGMPYPTKADVCSDGQYCSKAKDAKVISNIYDLFGLIPFGPDDLLPNEGSQATKLMEKMEICSPEAITAKKREMWGEFLTGTVSNLGKKQTNEDMLGQITGILQSSGNSSMGAVTSLMPGIAGMMMK